MKPEYVILLGVWLLSFLLLGTLPRGKRRMASIAFLCKQWITCLLGHATVELGLISYPVRELASVSRTSFTYEFMAYPTVCALFMAHYPAHKPRWIQFGYFSLFTSVLTGLEWAMERYTGLIRYQHWNALCSWFSLFATFLITRLFCFRYFCTLDADRLPPAPDGMNGSRSQQREKRQPEQASAEQ